MRLGVVGADVGDEALNDRLRSSAIDVEVDLAPDDRRHLDRIETQRKRADSALVNAAGRRPRQLLATPIRVHRSIGDDRQHEVHAAHGLGDALDEVITDA